MAIVALGLGACGSVPKSTEASKGGSVMRVDILGFAGCPNTPEFRRRIEAAARTVDGVVVEYVDQEALRAGDPRRGYPTPTALVDGRDLFGLPPPEGPNLGCRLYPGGLPDEEAIAARLLAAQSRPR